MLRTIFLLRTPLRSLHHSLHSIPPSPLSPPTLSRTRSFIGNPVGPPPPAAPAVLHRPFSSRRKKGGEDREEDDGDGLFLINRDPDKPPRLLAVQPRLRPDSLLQSKLSEALNLANSLEEQRDGLYAEEFGERDPPPHLVVQNPAARSVRAHADTYFGPGTVDSVKCHIKGLESEEELDAVFVNTILSGIQQRNLERAWGKPVLDRVALIIEIFNAHAQTKEAKLQSELAALMYKRTRLVRLRGPGGRLTFGASGEAEVVSARGRGSGGRGFISGAGETELQLQRRRIQERRSHLLTQIEEVRRTRALQRYARKRHGGSHGQGLATVAIVGYTNAGKSTLVSALSQSDLYSDARLFATVDPRLRSVILPSGRKALLSDTVGFISDLPVQLVEAFHATLEEVVEADLLVHVLDSSAKNLVEQRSTVLQVLQQIGVSEEKIQNMIEVWNKIDLLEGETGADKILDQNDDFDEGEDEEVGKFSGDEEMVSELSSEEPEKEDDLETGDTLDQGEDLNEDKNEDYGSFSGEEEDMTSGEPMDEDDLVSGQSHSLEERLADFDVPQDEAFKQCQHEDAQHVKTSAVLGVGLQELLYLIDEKLSAQESTEKRTFESFDRKWRPLYARDGEKVAEL